MQHGLQFFFRPFLGADKVSAAQIGFHCIGSFLIVYNPRSCLSCEGFADGFWHGYQSSSSTPFEIVDDCFDLWPHATFSKMTLLVVTFGLTERNTIQIILVGFLEVQSSFLY